MVGFFDSWPARRQFPVDMAGFAINLKFLKPNAVMPYVAGYEEDKFLRSLNLQLEDIEPLADNCSKVLVWHTRTTKIHKPTLKVDLQDINNVQKFDNFARLLRELYNLGIVQFNSNNGTKLFITRTKHENLSKLVDTNSERVDVNVLLTRARRQTVPMSPVANLVERLYRHINDIDYF